MKSQVYDPATNKWSVFMTLSTAFYTVDNAAVANNGMIYVIGGYDANYTAYSRMYAIDVNSKTTIAMPPMNVQRGDAHAVLYTFERTGKKAIIIAGGFTHVNNFCAALSSAEMYDIDEEKWIRLSDMSESRGDKAIVELNGLVYTIGGEAKHKDNCDPGVTVDASSASIAIDDVEAFDPRAGLDSEWMIKADLKDYRFRSASAVWKDRSGKSTVYVFGGQTAYNAVCNCFGVSDRIFAFSVEDEKSSGANKVATAVGASIGSVAFLAIVGYFVWSKKRSKKETSPGNKKYAGDVNEYGIN
jgi:hypothetical protein